MAFNNNKGEYEFPFEINDVDPETNKELLQYFTGEKTGFLQVGPEKYFFPSNFRNASTYIYNFQARSDDIWVASFPRSGTTWTQELVWMIANDLDYEGSQKEVLNKRFPFFEFAVFMHDKTKAEILEMNSGNPEHQKMVEIVSRPAYEYLSQVKSPRFIKTHLPFSLLPPSVMENQSKVIYVARNPMDVAVSYYHLNRLYKTQGYIGDFPRYWGYFERNLNPWMPYWSHIKEGWAHRYHSNVLFMFYEDICKDIVGTIKKVANFLNKTIKDEDIPKFSNYLNIKNFRNNPSVNSEELEEIHILKKGEQRFVRNGKTGNVQEEFTPELRERAEKWIEMNLKDTDIRFPIK